MENHNVPIEIQGEILKKLPIKSLVRFRSVSNSWKSSIQSSRFIADYQQTQCLLVRYSDNTYGLKYASVVDDDDIYPMFSLSAPMYANLHYKPTVIGGSQGLFCMYNCPSYSSTMTAVIWNPVIRKSVDIVVPNVLDMWPYKTIIGFGVSPQTCDPKLLKIVNLESTDYIEKDISQRVEVFTLSSGNWTSLSYNLPRKSIWFSRNQVDIDRLIYWSVLDRFYLDGRSRGKNMIISFDLTSKEFTELYLPDSLSDYDETKFKISKLKASLVVIEWKCLGPLAKRDYGVWMMENGDPKSFTKLYTIESPGVSSISEVHGFSKTGKPIIVMKNYSSEPDSLSVYEPNTKDINKIGTPWKHGICFAISYTETLLLLDHRK